MVLGSFWDKDFVLLTQLVTQEGKLLVQGDPADPAVALILPSSRVGRKSSRHYRREGELAGPGKGTALAESSTRILASSYYVHTFKWFYSVHMWTG